MDTVTDKTLVRLHTVMLEILAVFINICESNNLTFFLTAGTLLGAVRHKGFIPWDDDIDVAMPRNDYELFLEILEKSDVPGYNILSYRTKSNAAKYCKNFAKLCKVNTVFAESYVRPDSYCGIHIDIFPFDNSIIFFGPLQMGLIRTLSFLYRLKTKTLLPARKKWKIISIHILYCFFYFFPIKIIEYLRQKTFIIFNNIKTKYITFFSGIYKYKRETHLYTDVFPLSTVSFEGQNYCSPCNYDSYLRSLYGNYMELPPIEKQRTHKPCFVKFD